ncbi:hypothetical protein AAKU55_005599 [Oxalobacteraceae bacterium GrIS 1.11]
MSAYTVTVCMLDQIRLRFYAIGRDSAAVNIAAQDRFGPCGASVKPV